MTPDSKKVHPHEPPRLPLANLPTPVVELRRLADELGVPRVLMKRDDLTGLELTGNKVRKLEYLVADALAQDADTLVTMGGWQSNHCRATAAVAARLGLRCRLILRGPEGGAAANVGNLMLDRLFGAEVALFAPPEYHGRRAEIVESILSTERAAGRRPYFFGVGGSTPTGCWGYVRTMWELSRQLPADGRYDLFLALSSCGTMAGAIAGQKLFGLDHVRVVGVLVSDDVPYFRREVPEHVRAFCEQFDLPREIIPKADDLHLVGDHVGGGYAIPTESSLAALRSVARLEGVLTDPVYTAKSMDGMIATIRRGGVTNGATPIFLHTGGVFGMLARSDLFDGGQTHR